MKLLPILASTILLASCASDRTSQNIYSASEIGQTIKIKSCIIISSRSVVIRDENSGDKGEALGFFAGNIGGRQRNKPISGFIGGLVGGVVGRHVSDSLHERDGVEYTVILRDGDERQLVQDIREGETILVVGDSCRIQLTGSNKRVLPSNHFPTNVNRPKKVTFTN